MSAGATRASGPAVLGIEVRRTGAVPVAAVLALTGVVLLVAKQPPFQQHSQWSSTWADAAGWLSTISVVLGPMAGTAAAWVGGREGRRAMTELLATTPRPRAQRLLTTWVGVTAGVLGGYLAYAAMVAAAIAPTVSYAGGRWVGAWWLVALGWVSCAGIGFAAGRLVGGRLVAPAVGIALYLGDGIPSYLRGSWVHLAPVAQLPSSAGTRLVGWVIPAASAWLLGLTATALALAVARRRLWALLPAVVAAAVAVPLTHPTGAAFGYAASSWTESDPAATRQVCTHDVPMVCVFAEHAGLLPAVTPTARRALASISSVVGLDRAVEADPAHPAPAGALPLVGLTGHSRAFRAGLAHPGDIREQSTFGLTWPQCVDPGREEAFFTDTRAQAAREVAQSLVHGGPPGPSTGSAASSTVLDRLTGDPSAARAWMAAYLPAAQHCDVPALARLGTP